MKIKEEKNSIRLFDYESKTGIRRKRQKTLHIEKFLLVFLDEKIGLEKFGKSKFNYFIYLIFKFLIFFG